MLARKYLGHNSIDRRLAAVCDSRKTESEKRDDDCLGSWYDDAPDNAGQGCEDDEGFAAPVVRCLADLRHQGERRDGDEGAEPDCRSGVYRW